MASLLLVLCHCWQGGFIPLDFKQEGDMIPTRVRDPTVLQKQSILRVAYTDLTGLLGW